MLLGIKAKQCRIRLSSQHVLQKIDTHGWAEAHV